MNLACGEFTPGLDFEVENPATIQKGPVWASFVSDLFLCFVFFEKLKISSDGCLKMMAGELLSGMAWTTDGAGFYGKLNKKNIQLLLRKRTREN